MNKIVFRKPSWNDWIVAATLNKKWQFIEILPDMPGKKKTVCKLESSLWDFVDEDFFYFKMKKVFFFAFVLFLCVIQGKWECFLIPTSIVIQDKANRNTSEK